MKKCGICGFETLETNFRRHFSSAHGIRTPKLMIEAKDHFEVLMPTFAELPDLDKLGCLSIAKYQKKGTCTAPFEMCCDEHIVLEQLRQGRKVKYELKDIAATMLEEAGKTDKDF